MRKKLSIILFFLAVLLIGLLQFSNKNVAFAQGNSDNVGSHRQKRTFILNSAVDTVIPLPVSNEPVFVMASFSNISGPGGRVTSTGLVAHDTFVYDSATNTTHGTAYPNEPRDSWDRVAWSTGGYLIALLNPSNNNTFVLSLSSAGATNEITHAVLTVTMLW
ncbi:MAG: hypothetical protein A2831_01235 [Candidatus Yanofskybacteria bacterium RIFCSPHIGHO2_01_FULL_44_17]|uniref:Uncharacterized protein n=1 Tax=Candidatus Yanofskybacteria bacterium RIFCSPHIGHO2_01_FULL_44_17 TaxID=1802668 RepID=A0A1F8ETV8_9BACT|nr:MAG: hypothetical protein A2831_01235 [Candidatus Yanofskybacteria bacterium RIFCSPHIGHO2_01_FULL_44_17]